MAEEILRAVPYQVAAAELVVEREVLHVRTEPAEEEEDEADEPDKTDEAEEVTLQPLVDAGLLQVLSPEGEEEQATFVGLALELDDGEAMTGALAIHRGAAVATDDRKAIRVLTEKVEPGVEIFRTSELVKAWADAADISGDHLKEVLRRIETLASFAPPQDDPLREWWHEAGA